MTGIVADIVVMGEEQPRHAGLHVVEIVEADQRILGQIIDLLIEARDHHPQPCASALAEGHHHGVGLLQAGVLFAPALVALSADALGLIRSGEVEPELEQAASRLAPDNLTGLWKAGAKNSYRVVHVLIKRRTGAGPRSCLLPAIQLVSRQSLGHPVQACHAGPLACSVSPRPSGRALSCGVDYSFHREFATSKK